MLSCLNGFGIATYHVVDERLGEWLWLTLGIHMLDVPELVPVGLGVGSGGSNAIDREQSDVAITVQPLTTVDNSSFFPNRLTDPLASPYPFF